MRLIQTLTLFAFAVFLNLTPDLSNAVDSDSHSHGITNLPESQNQIIKLTDRGIEPFNLSMKLEDSIVFLLNATKDSLATLEVDFSGKKTHCATKNLKVENNMRLHSIRPYGPGDFASFCFHERGRYPFTVYGLKAAPKGLSGSILVE